ncbi:MAG: hypothetical protein H0U24_04670 [Thermoleophilaceae bacterium]|nr:hypothetical protein [Thermoleophilaceae bacterium]
MRAASVLLFAGASILSAGCSDAPDDRPARSVTVPPSKAVEIRAEEYRFDPGRVVVKEAGAGARLRIVMRNRGKLAHNLNVRKEDRDLASIRSFPPGQERAVSASLTPGDYELVCTVADHEDLGMVGKLEVR